MPPRIPGAHAEEPLPLTTLAYRLNGRGFSHPELAEWRGVLVNMTSPRACPKSTCGEDLKVARGDGGRSQFLLFCATCQDVFEPSELGTTDEALAASVRAPADPAVARDAAVEVPVVGLPRDRERSLRDRYQLLAATFNPVAMRLASWGMTTAMPPDLVEKGLELWASWLGMNAGRDPWRTPALLLADRKVILEGGDPGDQEPKRDEELRLWFAMLWAAFDIEGEVLSAWGMTSAMPNQLREPLFGEWVERLGRNPAGEPAGNARRTLDSLARDRKFLVSLHEEPAT